jgi:predicted nucleic acid-binding Zn ribbon protein
MARRTVSEVYGFTYFERRCIYCRTPFVATNSRRVKCSDKCSWKVKVEMARCDLCEVKIPASEKVCSPQCAAAIEYYQARIARAAEFRMSVVAIKRALAPSRARSMDPARRRELTERLRDLKARDCYAGATELAG